MLEIVQCGNPTCRQPLGTRLSGLVKVEAHIRGGQKRIIKAAACSIVCEKCGHETEFLPSRGRELEVSRGPSYATSP